MPRLESPGGDASIRTVAVIGAGEQGRAFAFRCVRAGFSTALEDVMPSRLRRAGQELAGISEPALSSRLTYASTVEDAVRHADVAIDFVPDELESKLEIFSLLDRMAPPRTILCTPTRALSIADLAACTYRSDRCVALEISEAAWSGGHLRVITGPRTAASTTGAVVRWLQELGAAAEVAADTWVDGTP